eukprot:505578-Prymnesium_polylepis.1
MLASRTVPAIERHGAVDVHDHRPAGRAAEPLARRLGAHVVARVAARQAGVVAAPATPARHALVVAVAAPAARCLRVRRDAAVQLQPGARVDQDQPAAAAGLVARADGRDVRVRGARAIRAAPALVRVARVDRRVVRHRRVAKRLARLRVVRAGAVAARAAVRRARPVVSGAGVGVAAAAHAIRADVRRRLHRQPARRCQLEGARRDVGALAERDAAVPLKGERARAEG